MKTLNLFRKRRLQQHRHRTQDTATPPSPKARQARPKSYLEDEDTALFI
jgi:hypothetical protein